MIQRNVPFPTEGLIPEHRQIGRIPTIDGLERRLLQANHWAIIDQRRVGKSSVATAAISRLARRPDVATVAVDLRSLGAKNEGDLVRALRAAAADGGIGGDKALKKTIAGIRGLLQGRPARVVKDVARLAGLPDQVTDVADIADALGGLVGGDELPDLALQIQIFEAWALTHDRAVVVFIDEVQDLAHWRDGATVAGLARAMRTPLEQVRLVFAGSETSAMRDLFGPGQPLREHTLDFDLPEIAREDWLRELPRRFREEGFTVDQDAIEAALDASPGRPLRTNQICVQAVNGAPDYGFADHINLTVMQYAIGLIQRRDQQQGTTDDA